MAKKKTTSKSIPPGRTTPVPRRPDRDRRIRQSQRIARVLGVLNLIQSRGRWNAKAIAEELEVSERTVYRDLEVLEFAGVPWYFDDGGQCYRVRPDYRFPTLTLTEDEALGQAMATVISAAPGLDVGQGATPTTRKLAANSAIEVQQLFADAARLIHAFDLKLADHSKHLEAIKTTQAALLHQRQLTGNYESPYEPKPVRIVMHPYRLCLIKQAWYIIGRIDGEDSPKTFRVARFKTLRELSKAAEIPEDFDLRSYFGNAWAVFRGDQTFDIELRFLPAAATVVQETTWYHTQKVKKQKDGSVTLSLKVDGLDEILYWILSWSGKVLVQKPKELQELYVNRLQEAVRINSDNPL